MCLGASSVCRYQILKGNKNKQIVTMLVSGIWSNLELCSSLPHVLLGSGHIAQQPGTHFKDNTKACLRCAMYDGIFVWKALECPHWLVTSSVSVLKRMMDVTSQLLSAQLLIITAISLKKPFLAQAIQGVRCVHYMSHFIAYSTRGHLTLSLRTTVVTLLFKEEEDLFILRKGHH